MRTVHFNGHLYQEGVCPEGCVYRGGCLGRCVQGVCPGSCVERKICPVGLCPGGSVCQECTPPLDPEADTPLPLWTEWQTCVKNITLP